MTLGTFRDGHPRIALTLPGRNAPQTIEFIVDTGFEGDLAIPDNLAQHLDFQQAGSTIRLLADGSPFRCLTLEVFLDDTLVSRVVEVLILPGSPLLGTTLLQDYLLQIEVTEGGEVAVEPL